MKKCSYCGRENEVQATHCRECGVNFAVPVREHCQQARESPTSTALTPQRPSAVRRGFVVGAWTGAWLTVVAYVVLLIQAAWGPILFYIVVAPAAYLWAPLGYKLYGGNQGLFVGIVLYLLVPVLSNSALFAVTGGIVGFVVDRFRRASKGIK